MLILKRASAGSGKTYELAKTYIKLLLTLKRGRKPRILRNEASIREALSGIMAVTFTVKATAEMKQRIVEKLAELAGADGIDDAEVKKIDYLEEFMRDFGASRMEISRLASGALRTLLLHYSDFKVQTIDSFFQSILHTFAYEASLEDDFNMEIDTDFITSVGFDTILDDLSERGSSSELKNTNIHWLKELIGGRMGTKKWNVFSRQSSKGSLYSELITEAKNLEKEAYQSKREALYKYFRGREENFKDIVEEVDRANFQPWEEFHNRRREKAVELIRELKRGGLEPGHIFRSRGTYLIESTKAFDRNDFTPPTSQVKTAASGSSLSSAGEQALKSNIQSNPEINSTIKNDIDSAYVEWMEANNEYLEAFENHREGLNTWMIYRAMLPKLMVVLDIAREKDAYLRSNNSIQISDTTHILSRIIGDNDVPFVYERMGSRLEHYLIDEFQDTSRMQWKNLYPLLSESDGSGHANLIIGDAKQSIYRFRNADSSLINEMDGKFSELVDYTTEKKPDDRSKASFNFRSMPCVVEFNNFIFSNIVNVEATDKKKGDFPLFSRVVKDTYADCIQGLPPHKSYPFKGYVEVVITPKVGTQERGDYDTAGSTSLGETGFVELPGRILELVSRGYSFSDIAVLVKSHEHGMAAVEMINRHNSEPENVQIPVISEENLLVSSALSVKIVIHALEMSVEGLKRKVKENPVLQEPIEEEDIKALFLTLPSLALPSVVEAIIDRFVPAESKKNEAPFIAAFQDAVIEYGATHSSDIGSFLKWWRQKSKTLSITSPEDSEGVVVQTIHKAKGLEYKCVIIPMANFSFEPSTLHNEWRWVRPSDKVMKAELLPPFIPIETKSGLQDTVHSEIREEYCREFALDELNKMYVAFTRAVDELYIYVPYSKKNPDRKAGGILESLLTGEEYRASREELCPDGRFDISGNSDSRLEVKFGIPADSENIRKEKEKKEKRNRGKEFIRLEKYEINSGSRGLRICEENRLLNQPLHTGDSDDELNPRAEGTLKHRIMQLTLVPADIEKALLEMKTGGLVSAAQVQEWGEQLKTAIAAVEERGWFDPANRIISERPILLNDGSQYRPDRIVVTPGQEAVIIDYKFGSEESRYLKQIKKYADLLKETGAFNSVKSYLWYVESGKIVEG